MPPTRIHSALLLGLCVLWSCSEPSAVTESSTPPEAQLRFRSQRCLFRSYSARLTRMCAVNACWPAPFPRRRHPDGSLDPGAPRQVSASSPYVHTLFRSPAHLGETRAPREGVVLSDPCRHSPPTEWTLLEPGPQLGSAVRLAPDPPILACGLPLTETMPLTTADGSRWVVYIEGFQRESPRFPHRTTIPGRRLRFDSDHGSWVSLDVPAGAPFLGQERLEELLGRAQLLPLPSLPARPPRRAKVRSAIVWRWMVERVGRGVRRTRAMAAQIHRRWLQDCASTAARLHSAMVSSAVAPSAAPVTGQPRPRRARPRRHAHGHRYGPALPSHPTGR
jgi:hypothetical protein